MTKKRILLGAVVVLPLAAWLAFGVFGVHTLFIEDRVNEAGPVFASEVASTTIKPQENSEADPSRDADPQSGNETSGLTTGAGSQSVAESNNAVSSTEAEVPDGSDDAPETAEIVTVLEGSFIDRIHPATGIASVLSDGSEQRFLRFEDFETDNGPDLFVYLTTEDAAGDNGRFGAEGEFIDLGQLKGNIGDQNYEIPADVDIDKFNTVVIWCRRFAVAFGAADLS